MLAKKYKLPVQEFTQIRPLKTQRSDFFSLKMWANNLDYSRFGVVISKKVDKRAVYRNKIKRIIFDFIRLNGLYKQPKNDVLIIIAPKIGGLDRQEIEEQLKDIFGC